VPQLKLSRPVLALLAFVCALALVDMAFFTALVPLLPHYAQVAGLTKAAAGLLSAAYPAGTLVGALPGGAVTARLGARVVTVSGLLLMSGSILVFAWASAPAVLATARFVQGLGGAFSLGAGMAWLASAAPPERRGEVLGTALGAAVVGALVGPVVGTLAIHVGTGPAFSAATVAGSILTVVAFLVPRPPATPPQRLRAAWPALRDRQVAAGLWLTMVAGLAFGMLDVLAPLRLGRLAASATVIAATLIGAAAIESALSPLTGRLSDRRGALTPVRISLIAAVAVSLLVPLLAPAPVLVALLVIGLPAYGTLFVPASSMLSAGAARLGLHQGIAFGLDNLAWSSGAAIAAAASGALAKATTELVPLGLLAAVCLATLVTAQMSASRARQRQRTADRAALDFAAIIAYSHRAQRGCGRDPSDRVPGP
jgi:MFS family permease